MTLKDTLMRATVGAAMIALSGGVAMAADSSAPTSSAPTTSAPAMTAPNGGAGAGAHAGVNNGPSAGANADVGTGGKAGANAQLNSKDEGTNSATAPDTAMSGKPATPPKSIVGKDVVNTKGEKVGEVSKLSGDQVIVSSGGFLGIGAHDVAIPWSQVTMQGAGDKAKLQISMTKDELKQMPEYKEPKATTGATGGAGSMAPNATGGGSSEDTNGNATTGH